MFSMPAMKMSIVFKSFELHPLNVVFQMYFEYTSTAKQTFVCVYCSTLTIRVPDNHLLVHESFRFIFLVLL